MVYWRLYEQDENVYWIQGQPNLLVVENEDLYRPLWDFDLWVQHNVT